MECIQQEEAQTRQFRTVLNDLYLENWHFLCQQTDRQMDRVTDRQTDNNDRWTQPVTLPLVHVHGVKTNSELDYNTIKFVPYWASIQLMFGFNTSIALIFYILYVLERVSKDRKKH